MATIQNFVSIIKSISIENGFMQVAEMFRTINKMDIAEIIIFWQTLRHFELAKNIEANDQVTNLKRVTILAMKDALDRTYPQTSLITVMDSPRGKLCEKIRLCLGGEDKRLFGKDIF